MVTSAMKRRQDAELGGPCGLTVRTTDQVVPCSVLRHSPTPVLRHCGGSSTQQLFNSVPHLRKLGESPQFFPTCAGLGLAQVGIFPRDFCASWARTSRIPEWRETGFWSRSAQVGIFSAFLGVFLRKLGDFSGVARGPKGQRFKGAEGVLLRRTRGTCGLERPHHGASRRPSPVLGTQCPASALLSEQRSSFRRSHTCIMYLSTL